MRFSHVSGAPLLDLINTVHWRLDPVQRMDELEGYRDVLAWCVESALVTVAESRLLAEQSDAKPGRAAAEHLEVLGVRESAYEALFNSSAEALAHLTELHRAGIAAASLERTGDNFTWVDTELTLAAPRCRVVRGLVDLLARNDLDRLHQCEDYACGWVYLDSSPRRNRRWCVSADCGDRNRARAYYARNKAASS